MPQVTALSVKPGRHPELIQSSASSHPSPNRRSTHLSSVSPPSHPDFTANGHQEGSYSGLYTAPPHRPPYHEYAAYPYPPHTIHRSSDAAYCMQLIIRMFHIYIDLQQDDHLVRARACFVYSNSSERKGRLARFRNFNSFIYLYERGYYSSIMLRNACDGDTKSRNTRSSTQERDSRTASLHPTFGQYPACLFLASHGYTALNHFEWWLGIPPAAHK